FLQCNLMLLCLQVKGYGNVLIQAVMKDINVLESDYFGIQYEDKGNLVFLDPLKKINSQIKNISNVVLRFVVKFFPPDPGQLQEEYTRYLFALQIKQDLVNGLLPCNEGTAVAMCSYIAQSEFGDWNSYDCSDLSYLNDLALLPPLADLSKQELLGKIAESHKIRTGESKADSDFHLLDIVRRLEQYGLRLLPAKDQENTDIKLAVAHMGVLVFRGNAKINTFNWARIRKLSFKKKRFLIKLRTETSVDVSYFVASYISCYRLNHYRAPVSQWQLSAVSNASKNLSFGHPNPAIQSIHDQSRTISLSESEVSIPGMGGGEPRTPSQYAALEQKMIKAGYPSSQAYYIAKEILTTERTYVKDLEVITKWFKSALQKESSDFLLPENLANQLFGGIGSLVALHQQFLCTLDDRLSSWEGRGSTGASNDQLVDDLMLNHMLVLKKYLGSLENGESLILALEETGEDSRFESIYREFELQKVCYLPFNSFLLKPMQRVVHYKLVVERLIGYYEDDSSMDNHSDLQTAYQEATALATAIQERLKRAHNLQKLAQLRRDLLGVDNLIKAKRDFIREGSLYKLSRKGFQQRLFFLFSDCLVYTSKGVTSTNQFKVHAELPLQGMIGESAVPNCFSILSGTKTVIVAAATQEEMDKWLEDFSVAIALAGRDTTLFDSPLNNTTGFSQTSMIPPGSMSRLSMEQSSEDGEGSVRNSMERLKPPMQHRSNATMHVCWHRNTSVSSSDHLVSLRNQLSGYLLRKFKNSNGWQKLWVVFTNFCLFFYKSHQDESPLASLPLLGYTINSPSENDGIRKDFVFKLKFKTHVYFFRAESQFTYNRWLEVVSSATVTSQRTRLFSRMDSYQ
uniref:FERM, RhoGEF and pleckstrin domain protein 2 n=1 Tax=Ciona savignyi TaxID=51511 RepID=H2Z4V4_CIOSA